MCDFNNLTNDEKLYYHNVLTQAAKNYGGLNFFLQLVEAIRDTSPHPLTSRHQDFLFDLGDIRWGKTIFNDKILLIEKLRKEKNNNLIENKTGKEYKKILNLIKTLSPITFSVRPARRDDGEGFDFKAFDTLNDKTIKFNPIFEALFFCNSDTVKKILNYSA
jgi:hypothetical protein